jgi:iron complex transport system ATP-binding protein
VIAGSGLSLGAIVHEASLGVDRGELVVLLGPNGAGKTTLLRLLLGLARADGGTALIDGEAAAGLRPEARARAVAYLPQARPLAWPASVRDVVVLGRFAYGSGPGRLGGRDGAAVERALDACGLETLAGRAADTLSGGELARVHVARALATEAPLIVADEPVASLDPQHQHRVMGLIAGFVRAGGGALVVLHDLDLAARYADRLVWMERGCIVADGSVAATMTVERIAAVYGVRARVGDGGVTVEGVL